MLEALINPQSIRSYSGKPTQPNYGKRKTKTSSSDVKDTAEPLFPIQLDVATPANAGPYGPLTSDAIKTEETSNSMTVAVLPTDTQYIADGATEVAANTNIIVEDAETREQGIPRTPLTPATRQPYVRESSFSVFPVAIAGVAVVGLLYFLLRKK